MTPSSLRRLPGPLVAEPAAVENGDNTIEK